jgi:hypothetical protein
MEMVCISIPVGLIIMRLQDTGSKADEAEKPAQHVYQWMAHQSFRELSFSL